MAVILFVIILSHPHMQWNRIEIELLNLICSHGIGVFNVNVTAPFQIIDTGERKASTAIRPGRDQVFPGIVCGKEISDFADERLVPGFDSFRV